MSSTVYGNLRDLKLDLNNVGGLSGSFVTAITAQKSSTLQGGLIGYYRLGHGSAGTVSNGTVIVNQITSTPVLNSTASIVLASTGSERQHFGERAGDIPWAEVGDKFNGVMRFNKNSVSVAPYSSLNTTTAGAYLMLNHELCSTIRSNKKYTISMWFKIDKNLPSESTFRMGLWDLAGEHQLYWRHVPTGDSVSKRLLYFLADSLQSRAERGGAASSNDIAWQFGATSIAGDPTFTKTAATSLERDDNILFEDEWNHIVLSVDWNHVSHECQPKLWLNGKRMLADSIFFEKTEVWQEPDTNNSGFGLASHPTPSARCNFQGWMFEAAIWDRVLTDLEAESLYEMKYGFASPSSGYLEGETPRLKLRRLDNRTGSYPTAKRMHYGDRHGSYPVSFNDRSTRVFSNAATDHPMPYELRKDFTIEVGPGYKITPTLKLRESPHHTSPLISYLTKSISYNKSDSLIAFFHMPITGTVMHGAVCNSVSGSTVYAPATHGDISPTDISGHMYSWNTGSDTYDQIKIPSASAETPFHTIEEQLDFSINAHKKYRPKNIRSISFEPENRSMITAGGASWWRSQLTGSQKISFAAWIKPEHHNDTSTKYQHLFKIGETGRFQAYIRSYAGDSQDREIFVVADWWDGGSEHKYEQYRTVEKVTNDRWQHVAVTYDWNMQPVGNDNEEGFVTGSISLFGGLVNIPTRKRIVNVYLDGHLCTLDNVSQESGLDASKHNEMPYFDVHGRIGNQTISSDAVLADQSFRGKMCEPAFWNNVLTPEDVKAIYMSSFIDRSLVRYPTMLPHKHVNHKNIAPHSDIVAPGNTMKGISDSNVTFEDAMGDSLVPYNDSRVNLQDSRFYKEGTSRELLPGFGSPLKSKTQIVLNLPIGEQAIVTRYNNHHAVTARSITGYRARNRAGASDAGDGPFFTADTSVSLGQSNDKTGFLYYNFGEKRFEQIGLIDPTNGNDLLHWWCATRLGYDDDDYASVTGFGTQFFPSQFYPGNGNKHNASYIEVNKNMGLPHFSNFAPNATMYHATSSQCLNMSNYIDAPFMLEKVVLEVPAMAHRTYYDGTGYPDDDARDVTGEHSQQDNYVFFLYRQQDNTPGSKRDTANHAKGTQRYLVCSGVAAFYSSVGHNGVNPISYTPLNSPSFSKDLKYNKSLGSHHVSQFTGSMRIEMIPAVANYRIHGKYNVPSIKNDNELADGGSADPTPVRGAIYCGWPGGTSTKTLWGYQCHVAHSGNNPTDTPTGGWSGGLLNAVHSSPNYLMYKWTNDRFYAEAVATSNTTSTKTILDAGAFRGHPVYELPNVPHTTRTSQGIATDLLANTRHGMYITGSVQNVFLTGSGLDDDHHGHRTFYGFQPWLGNLPDGLTMADPRVLAPFGGTSKVLGTPGAAYTDNNATTVSPYLLMPGDRLVLGIDAALDVSNDVAIYAPQSLTGSMLQIPADGTIPAGEFKITLYGSYIRENQEVSPTLNQHLTTLAVHEAIGSPPVRDQFDLEPLSALSGSYVDMMMSGSMTVSGTFSTGPGAASATHRRPQGALTTETTSERAPIRSFVGAVDPSGYFTKRYGVDPHSNAFTRVGTYVSLIGAAYGRNIKLQGDISRNVRLIDQSERYYDTMLPDLRYYLKLTGGGRFSRIFNTGSARQHAMRGYDDSGDELGYDEVLQYGRPEWQFGVDNPFLQGSDDFSDVFTFATTASLYSPWHGQIRKHSKWDSDFDGTTYSDLSGSASTDADDAVWGIRTSFLSGSDHQLERFREAWVYDQYGDINATNYVTGTQNGYSYPRMRFPYDGNPPRRIHQKCRMHLSSTILARSYDHVSQFNWSTNRLHYMKLTAFTVAGDKHGGKPNIWHWFADYNKIREMIWATGWDYPGQWRYGVPEHASRKNGSSPASKYNGGFNYGAKGIRYGLKNYNPEVSSAVFRRDSYGQFRDMLEQREFTTYFIRIDPKSVRGLRTGDPFNSRMRRRNRLETGPVVCRFVSASDGVTLVDPKQTSCSNISIFATSSKPYTEGKPGNSHVFDGTRNLQALVATDTPVMTLDAAEDAEGMTDGDVSTEDSGGGGTVICTELFRQGLLSAEIYAADEAFGRDIELRSNKTLVGYRTWAQPLASRMRHSKILTYTVSKFAIPWACHMAYKMGVLEKDNLFGRILMPIGIAFSRAVYFIFSKKIKDINPLIENAAK